MILKPPGAELDYPITWTLASGETISSSSWAVSPTETGGLAVKSGSEAEASGVTSCLLQAGIVGHVYEVANTIVTSQGRTDVRTETVRIGNVEATA